MTLRNLSSLKILERNKLNNVCLSFFNAYSRRSNNNDGPYKVVTPEKVTNGVDNSNERDPNIEILMPSKGFPFFMPGNIGPAWQNIYSTVQNKNKFVMHEITDTSAKNLVCQIQECPRVLRQTVCDLFPNKNLDKSELSVITLTMIPDVKSIRFNKEIETEKLAQCFVLAASSICRKLHNSGYWGDFINPFSGRPYINPMNDVNALYATDEKFRCLDFQIITIKDCKVISNEEDKKSSKRFIGSLFTNAPCNKSYLNSIFIKDE